MNTDSLFLFQIAYKIHTTNNENKPISKKAILIQSQLSFFAFCFLIRKDFVEACRLIF